MGHFNDTNRYGGTLLRCQYLHMFDFPTSLCVVTALHNMRRCRLSFIWFVLFAMPAASRATKPANRALR